MEDEEQERYDPFPETVRDQAIAHLRDLLKGNGVSPDKLDYETLEGGLYNIEGYTRIEISYTRTQGKESKKRKKGEYHKVESQQTLDDTIETMHRELCEKGDKRKHIIKQLLNTQDQGFNLQGYELDLSDFNCSFVLPRECGTCNHTGHVTCQSCHGNKRIQCQKCHGATQMTCPQCQGSSFIQGPNGRQTCQQCGGQGHVQCDHCRSSGFIACPKCGARGTITCQTCGGTGQHDEITHLAFHATTRLEYNTQNLPRGLVRLLHKQAGDLAAGEALTLKAEEDDADTSRDMIYVHYTGTLPYGKLHMRLNDKKLSAIIYGHDARLREVPSFLEHCCATGIKALKQAANSPNTSMSELEKAGRYDLIRQALILSSQHKPRQALQKISAQYPHGVRQATLKGLVIKSDQALRNITKRPRLTGMGIGLGICAFVITGYYLQLQTHLPILSPWQSWIFDLMLLVLCCALTSATIHLMATRALRRIFANLAGDAGQSPHLKPKLDLSISTGISSALGLYAAIVATLAVAGEKAPLWAKTAYTMLRNTIMQ